MTPSVALASAYPERAEFKPPWHDRLAQGLADHLWWPLASRMHNPAAGLARVLPLVGAAESAWGLQQADAAALGALPATLRRELRATPRLAVLPIEAVARTLAVVRELASRVLGQRPYPVQLMAAWALLQGRLAEMATGEGKSLATALAAAVAALAGRPVHVVTVNDYLAQRDADAFAPLFAALGLRTGCVVQGQPVPERRAAHRADITYISNKELAFDYLRDRVALSRGGGRLPMAVAALAAQASPHARSAAPDLLLRGLHVVLVDEADSVFIDEARTPLILSAQQDADEQRVTAQRCQRALALAAALQEGLHWSRRDAERRVLLSNEGEAELQRLASGEPADDGTEPAVAADAALDDPAWTNPRGRRELVEQALAARLHYLRDQHYLVTDGKVVIVDEATGRVMPERSWEAGLHQMIEAKEGLAITSRRVTLARITYQRFFRRCLHLAGTTGTASEVAGELWRVYRLRTVKVPLHRPSQRRVLPPSLLPTAAARWQAVAAQAGDVAQRLGRPVLIGTRSVAASEQLSAVLHDLGLPHALLNARQDADEAAIVARAGEPGRITVATNMAGRGTDIVLESEVAARGGLHVILTECHASARIDRQLLGRGARQGDPGSAQMLLAADDEVLRTWAAPLVALALQRWPAGAPPWATRLLCRVAQIRAGRAEAGQRRATLKLDEKLDRLLAFSGSPE